MGNKVHRHHDRFTIKTYINEIEIAKSVHLVTSNLYNVVLLQLLMGCASNHIYKSMNIWYIHIINVGNQMTVLAYGLILHLNST